MEINRLSVPDPTLILDLGNVVFSLNFSPFESWLVSTSKEKSRLNFERFWNIYSEYESGHFGNQDFLEKVKGDLNLAFEDEEFISMWNTCWEFDMPGLDSWLDKISGTLPIHVLSNTNDLHMECFLETKPVLKRFDRLFLSHEMGCRKPESEIYDKVTEDLGVSPASVLFFDDRLENVQGARDAGWRAEVFISIEESSARLERHWAEKT